MIDLKNFGTPKDAIEYLRELISKETNSDARKKLADQLEDVLANCPR